MGSDHLREALKLVAVLLKEAGVPFALAGSYGLWARGGPEPDHDVDFMIAEEDAPRVEDVLAESGLESVRMPVLPATVLMAGDNPFARALLGLLAALGVAPATHDHTATSDSGKE
ncbi:nucleotidyltransferase family protein [Nocardioides humi]|uniref:nucleotidyltransferase family protein n=1 Tax=Nocardioides humi TaxID=449461 RepID=UPI001C63CA87|nr:nucleotidyltransferase family protein [Nocardioides humi]